MSPETQKTRGRDSPNPPPEGAGGQSPGDTSFNSPARAIGVVLAVCLVCSLTVSTTAVLLRPLQRANAERARNATLIAVIAEVPGVRSLLADVAPTALETHVVDLNRGTYVDGIDPVTYDAVAAAAEPSQSIPLASADDVADIGRRENFATVHLLRERGRLRLVVLPVRGNGYMSTMFGYLVLAGDLETVAGIGFYKHEETPGLGGEIDDPEWLTKWRGKRVRDRQGNIRVHVAEGEAPEGDLHAVDGISGATFTGDGVTNLLQFWLGDLGFGTYIAHLRAEQGRKEDR